MCVEETLELMAGYEETSAFCPGIGLQRLGGGEQALPMGEEDGALEEYERITYDVFDKFIRHNFAQQAQKYQSIDDIDDQMYR